MTFEIRLPCPACRTGTIVRRSAAGTVSCPCGQEAPPVSLPDPTDPIVCCAACGGKALYKEKDFDRRKGLYLVLAAAALSFVIYGWNGIAGTLFLLAFAAVDAILYLRLPFRTVCYRCQAQHRGLAVAASTLPFDLGIAEGFRMRAQNPGEGPREGSGRGT